MIYTSRSYYRLAYKLISILSVVFLSACSIKDKGESKRGNESLSCSQFGIRNGAPTLVDEFEIIGNVLTSSGNLCTGTLVAPKTVLTAAHCVVVGADQVRSPSEVRFGLGQFALASQEFAVEEIIVHPDYEGGVIEKGDMAILKLELPASVGPFPLLPAQPIEFAVREPVRIVGYGKDENGNSGVKKKGTLAYNFLLDSTDLEEDTFLILNAQDDFGDQNACPGDSGGPALIDRNDGTVLAGVAHAINSSGAEACDNATLSFYTYTYTYLDWILEATGIVLESEPTSENDSPETGENSAASNETVSLDVCEE